MILRLHIWVSLKNTVVVLQIIIIIIIIIIITTTIIMMIIMIIFPIKLAHVITSMILDGLTRFTSYSGCQRHATDAHSLVESHVFSG